MYYYFHVKFKNNPDIYIVRVLVKIIDGNSEQKAMEIAKMMIMNQIVLVHYDFEIKRLTLEDLVLQLHFVKDISHIFNRL